jgi:SAM-dependent methyltransferase
MENKDLEKKYDKVFKEGAGNFFTSDYFEEALTIAGFHNWSGKRVLDIGCGEGRLCSMIAEAGASEVIGVDYSQEAIDNANSKFNLPNLKFIKDDYKNIEGKFDVVTMEGVMEHFDDPFFQLRDILDLVTEGGFVITSSPSFLNPRGYVWMTLAKLFNIPMSLTDLHFICPFDMKSFCDRYKYELEYKGVYQDWGSGTMMLTDFNKRLRNALKDAGMDDSGVSELLRWLRCASPYFKNHNDTGAVTVYKIKK